MLLFVFNVNSVSCLLFVQLVCVPELVLLIFKFHTLGLILESAHLLTLLPLFFNCLDSDLKQIACVSPSSIIYSSRLNNFKHKLFILFLQFASNVSHLEELMCYDCRFSFIVTVLEGNYFISSYILINYTFV